MDKEKRWSIYHQEFSPWRSLMLLKDFSIGKSSGTRIYHQGGTDADCLAEVLKMYSRLRTVSTRPDQHHVFQCHCSA